MVKSIKTPFLVEQKRKWIKRTITILDEIDLEAIKQSQYNSRIPNKQQFTTSVNLTLISGLWFCMFHKISGRFFFFLRILQKIKNLEIWDQKSVIDIIYICTDNSAIKLLYKQKGC